MNELVIGDIHFGTKSNSIEWLLKQCKLIDDQVSECVDKYKPNRVVFLGDVFDIRYSINQQIACEVKNSIRRLSEKLKSIGAYLVFVAGNHDYYSPLEEAKQYNAYETVFGSEFSKIHDNVYFVTDTPLLKDDSLFLPWYWTENTDHFDDLLYRFDFGNDVKAIYCHADLSIWPGPRVASLNGIPVYAGHIHYVNEDKICNLHNIGACCPLNFGDTNEDRYIYYLEDFVIKEKIKNITTPKFVRLYNEEIFNANKELFENSFVQLCISRKNIELAFYIDQIKKLKSIYVDSNIRIHLIEDDTRQDIGNANIDLNQNIYDYIKTNIPKELNNKFGIIVDKYKDAK